jgi:ABC-2 type transport system permease protein
MKNKNAKPKTEQKKRRSTAVIITVMVLLIAVLVNAGVYLAVEKFGWKADMTEGKLYELTDATTQVMDSLNQDVEIICTSSEQSAYSDIKEILSRYDNQSDRISVRYVDLTENPTFAQEYEEKGVQLYGNDVIVKSGDREKALTLYDLYEFDSNGTSITGYKLEQQVTSALQYVTNEELPLAVFTQGHNEYKGNSFPSLFDTNNYEVQDVTLTVEDIPAEAEIVVIAAPTRDFESAEIAKIDAFLARGGSLMVFQNPATSSLTNLEALLEEWGIKVGDYVVFDGESYTESPINIVASFVPHDINNYFSNNRYFILMPQSRNLELLDKEGKTVSPVLTTSDNAYGKIGTEFSTAQKEEGDKEDTFVLAATSTMDVKVDGETKTAKVFVSGSRNMYYDNYMSTSTFANSDFITQVIGWCNEEGTAINVPVKTKSTSYINMTMLPAIIICLVITIIIPLIVLGYGITVYFRRRHL